MGLFTSASSAPAVPVLGVHHLTHNMMERTLPWESGAGENESHFLTQSGIAALLSSLNFKNQK